MRLMSQESGPGIENGRDSARSRLPVPGVVGPAVGHVDVPVGAYALLTLRAILMALVQSGALLLRAGLVEGASVSTARALRDDVLLVRVLLVRALLIGLAVDLDLAKALELLALGDSPAGPAAQQAEREHGQQKGDCAQQEQHQRRGRERDVELVPLQRYLSSASGDHHEDDEKYHQDQQQQCQNDHDPYRKSREPGSRRCRGSALYSRASPSPRDTAALSRR